MQPDSQINHRLDKETSGILVIAKNADAYRHFSMELQERKTEKIYHAIVWGRHNFEQMLVEAPLEIKNNGKVIISKYGKYSATILRTLKIYNKLSLIECKLVTGRKHQIRIHLASGDAPIVNDEKYGDREFNKNIFNKQFQRMALHSSEIEFLDSDNKSIRIKAEPDDSFLDMVAFLK